MTVRELIAKLELFDPQLPVVIEVSREPYNREYDDVDVVVMVTDAYNPFTDADAGQPVTYPKAVMLV